MDREEIIRMAREAVRLPEPQTPQEEAIERALAPIFERFAALVAAAERTRLHDKFMEIHKSQQHSNNYWHFAARKIKEESWIEKK